MGRPPALNYVKNQFINKIDSSGSFYLVMEPFAIENIYDGITGYEPIHPSQAKKAITLAFLEIVISWEDFIESCFVRYLAGAKSPSGYSPTLRIGKCDSLKHAYDVISGKSAFDRSTSYLNWTSWKDIEKRAEVFFRGGEPFSKVTENEKQRVRDAFIIRNRIAHLSQKSRNQFITAAKQHLGLNSNQRLTQGFGVGSLLLTVSNRGFGKKKARSFFVQYSDLFLNLADKIAP